MSDKLRNNLKKIVLLLSVLVMVGCSVFPDRTTISASSKASNIDNPSIKASQTFKWSKKE